MFILADFMCDYYPVTEVKKDNNKKRKKTHKQVKKKIIVKKISSKTLADKTVGIVPCSKGRILIMESLVKNYVKSPIDDVKQELKRSNNRVTKKKCIRRNG